MFPPFPEEKAFEVLKKITESLKSGDLRLRKISRVSEERPNPGVMVGCLVCAGENGDEKNLVALSGNNYVMEGMSDRCGFTFVPSIVSPGMIDDALSGNDARIHQLTDEINSLRKIGGNSGKIAGLEEERKTLTTESLSKVHGLYSFMTSRGENMSLGEICMKRLKGRLPPTGTGDCSAPKLLDFAFRNGLTPVSLCEVFHGESATKKSGMKFPPCDSRCGVILPEILGLEILYRDEDIVVINKQSGILSIPGRTPDKQDCVTSRLRLLFPGAIQQPSVHRLDMETSGLMVLALTKEAHRNLSMQFEQKMVQKKYIALLDGVLHRKGIPETGERELFFRVDLENRPHQIWDDVHGKSAVTRWQVLGVEKYVSPSGKKIDATRVLFIPLTGRTHQLRLASADPHGFGVPIIGDTLYGHCEEGERLMLHACELEFTHPSTGERMRFENSPCF